MKEKIIHILQTYISAIQLCSDDDPIVIVGINIAADGIIKLIDAEVEKRISERMPSEEEIDNKYPFMRGSNNIYRRQGIEWLHSRLTENKQEGGEG